MTAPATATGGLPPGTRMGRYELLHRLAMGGMAELYVARQSGIEGFERTVVLKRVLPHLTDDPEFTRMFLDEARIAASLDHPNIAQVTDIDEQDGEFFFAMEYVHGRNLREVLKRAPDGLNLPLALTVVASTAAGLHHAHEAIGADGRPLGLVHRDVSPSNVMIGYNGAVKLTDFGIAKASARTSKTVGAQIKGKVGYMSPEQCRGEEVDRSTDVFALGILMYEATTGARAFYAPNDFAAMARIVKADYTPPEALDPAYPAALGRIIARALAKDPADRYPTVAQMHRELEAFAEAQGFAMSSTALAEHMVECFGTPAHPQTLPAPPTIDRPTKISTVVRGVSRPVFFAAILLSAVAAGGAAFAVGAGQTRVPETSPPAPDGDVSTPPDPATAPPASPAPPATGIPAAATEADAPEPTAVPAPATSLPDPPAASARKTKRPTKRKKKGRGRARESDDGHAATTKPSPFPPGFEP